jgi:arylsulfatase
MVGELLRLVDDLGAADNTIVVYTTDNAAEINSWPDGEATVQGREASSRQRREQAYRGRSDVTAEARSSDYR